jgi:hypothetical protein
MKEQEVSLTSNQPKTCLSLEPVWGEFRAADVDPSSVVIRSSSTGTVAEVAAIAGAGSDGNGEICFRTDAIRSLFAGVGGSALVSVSCDGRLLSGERFSATLPLRISAGTGRLAASITPHPVRAGSMLRFRTLRPGVARVSVHDVNGRLVRTLLDASTLPAGYHEVPFSGVKVEGGPGASGIYFYRIETAEGVQSGRAIVVR